MYFEYVILIKIGALSLLNISSLQNSIDQLSDSRYINIKLPNNTKRFSKLNPSDEEKQLYPQGPIQITALILKQEEEPDILFQIVPQNISDDSILYYQSSGTYTLQQTLETENKIKVSPVDNYEGIKEQQFTQFVEIATEIPYDQFDILGLCYSIFHQIDYQQYTSQQVQDKINQRTQQEFSLGNYQILQNIFEKYNNALLGQM